MALIVVFSPEVEKQLAELYRYIAAASSPETASRYMDALVAFCESLKTFPRRGTSRADIRPGCARQISESALLSHSAWMLNR